MKHLVFLLEEQLVRKVRGWLRPGAASEVSPGLSEEGAGKVRPPEVRRPSWVSGYRLRDSASRSKIDP